LAVVVALICGLAVGGTLARFATAPDPGPVDTTARAEALAPVERARAVGDRDTILEVIRDHRRQASERWRQQLADAIYDESLGASVDPLLVASIVAKESSFQSRAVSRAGAVGLMQLRPFVARDVAERYELEWDGLGTLHDPALNVRLGISYYKELVERFEGDEAKALTAYNYGPTRVSRQLSQGTYIGSRYAERVLRFYEELRADTPQFGSSRLAG
jgi:hypothetical protein